MDVTIIEYFKQMQLDFYARLERHGLSISGETEILYRPILDLIAQYDNGRAQGLFAFEVELHLNPLVKSIRRDIRFKNEGGLLKSTFLLEPLLNLLNEDLRVKSPTTGA